MVERLEEGLQFSFSEEGILVCVELVNEDREVTVLELVRKNDGGEFVRVPNDEVVVSSTPRCNRVRRWVFHHFKGLGKKRRRTRLVQPLHRLGREVGRGMEKEIQAAVRADQTIFLKKLIWPWVVARPPQGPPSKGGPWGGAATPKAK
jgi:hypothetical protein